MDRLTQTDEYGNADIIALSDMMPEIYAGLSFSETNALTDALNRLAAYEDTGLEPEDINDFVDSYKTMRDNEEARARLMCGTGVILPERAAEITKAEAEGRLLVLPCKVGDKVYQTDGIKIYESTVRQLIFDTENIAFDVCAIGKSIFRTREEAEAALKEREGT